MKNPADYEKLRSLLQKEEFPLEFTVKFIGRNSGRFQAGVQLFEAEYSHAKKTCSRESAQGAHLALTYVYTASDADSVIDILKRVARIEDLQVIL